MLTLNIILVEIIKEVYPMAKIAERTQTTQGKDGVLTLTQLRATGMSAMNASRAVKRGELLRIAHGVYQVPKQAQFLDDEMYSTQLRYNQIIYSHDTALYLHELNDRDPLRYSVTVPTGYNTKKLITEGAKVFSLKRDLYEEDIVEIATMHGNMVRLYNLERTICDCLRSRNKLQTEIVTAGVKGYVRRNDRNLNLLMKTAEKFKVTTILKTYLEVLL